MFSIVGKTLKFNTAQDVQDICRQILEIKDLKEIHLSGNTFGVEACEAIAKTLENQSHLKVSIYSKSTTLIEVDHWILRYFYRKIKK